MSEFYVPCQESVLAQRVLCRIGEKPGAVLFVSRRPPVIAIKRIIHKAPGKQGTAHSVGLPLYKKMYNIGCEKKQKIRCDFIESE